MVLFVLPAATASVAASHHEGRGRRILGDDARAGENGGRTLANANIVRSVERLGPAGEAPATWRVPAREGLEYAVLVQGEDGRILGAAATPR